MSEKIYKVAVIGHGYWGKNVARAFSQNPNFELSCICDFRPAALKGLEKLYPRSLLVDSLEKIPSDIDAVAIVTPVRSHTELARHFLHAGKHVWITKPLAPTAAEAQELVDLANHKGKCLFVDHTFVFNPAVKKLKELLPKIGQPYFIVSQRMNLGLYQPDVNVTLDLMPHDLSIICYLFDTEITQSTNTSFCAAGLPQQDFGHSTFQTANGLFGTITVSWLSPYKIRQFIVVGSNGMLSYDDSEVTEKIKYYDRGLSIGELSEPLSNQSYTARISYRSGDLFSPAIPNTEALATEMCEFEKSINDANIARQYSQMAMRVMRSLDLVQAKS